MTLKEKFDNVEICIESQLLNLRYDENMNCVEECEQIAEDFAIEFANWMRENEVHISIEDVGEYAFDIGVKNHTSKELLEMYKKTLEC